MKAAKCCWPAYKLMHIQLVSLSLSRPHVIDIIPIQLEFIDWSLDRVTILTGSQYYWNQSVPVVKNSFIIMQRKLWMLIVFEHFFFLLVHNFDENTAMVEDAAKKSMSSNLPQKMFLKMYNLVLTFKRVMV